MKASSRRRDFGRRHLLTAGGAALAAPSSARSQQSLRLVGVLMLGTPDDEVPKARLRAFRQALDVLGWTQDRTVRLEVRWASNQAADVERHAAELVALKPDVILANGTPSVVALKKATESIPPPSIPIVCALVQDPVGLGLVASLARPGGNITGFTYVNPELIGKWRGLLLDVAPATGRIGMLFNPSINAQYYSFLRELAPLAERPIDIAPKPVNTIEELRAAMAELASKGNGAAILPADPFTFSQSREAAALALQHRLPAISIYRPFAAEGGLMAYGPDSTEIFRRSASYVDRILKGTPPAELPVQQPDKFEFAINLRTAKALGLTVPPSLLALADDVIE
jgi:putative ABC transport system substrate-binding protein